MSEEPFPDLPDFNINEEQNAPNKSNVKKTKNNPTNFDNNFKDKIDNIMFIGSETIFKDVKKKIDQIGGYNLIFVEKIDLAINLLLQEIFAIVLLDAGKEDLDTIMVSRMVRVNHPLARIVIISTSRRSSFISDIINHGSVDGFIIFPIELGDFYNLITEHIANHEINKMITQFVSQPPKLSKASYLLLDPSLSFAKETNPAKFVGLMISYDSVPRYSKFFEELLSKDEILFSGYLSGISMLGRELFANKEPLREINFGGISVIIRFYQSIQFSIFIRNLTKHNFKQAEDIITETVNEIIDKRFNDIASMTFIKSDGLKEITQIVKKFEKANEKVINMDENQNQINHQQTILLYGDDLENHEKFKKYLEKKLPYNIEYVNNEESALEKIKTEGCAVLVVDSIITKGRDPISFSDYIKDLSPSTQIVYRIRDRRASQPLINALNSNHINFLIPWRVRLKSLSSWIEKGVEKSLNIRNQSSVGDGMDTTLDHKSVAMTMIRGMEENYLQEKSPKLYGIMITKEADIIFNRFWEIDNEKIDLNQDMLAGMVASLENVSDEMFSEGDDLGEVELGGANILVKHRGNFNLAFIMKNIDPNTSVVINKKLDKTSDDLYKILNLKNKELDSEEDLERIDQISNNLLSEFLELFQN